MAYFMHYCALFYTSKSRGIFPTDFDRPHSLKYFHTLRIRKHTTFSINGILASGRPLTVIEYADGPFLYSAIEMLIDCLFTRGLTYRSTITELFLKVNYQPNYLMEPIM